jgi:hypothetical protein
MDAGVNNFLGFCGAKTYSSKMARMPGYDDFISFCEAKTHSSKMAWATEKC